MATIIRIKRSANATAPSTLKLGEMAYAYGTGTASNGGDRLYIGTGGTDGSGNANSIDVVGGKYFTELFPTSNGVVSSEKLITTDSNNRIDTMVFGNSNTNAGQITFNEALNNGSNNIVLKAPTSLANSSTIVLPDGAGSQGQFLKVISANAGEATLGFDAVDTTLTLEDSAGATTDYSTANTLLLTGDGTIDTAVTSNTVTIKVQDGGIGTTQLANGGVTNAKLASDSITIGTTSTALGASNTDLAGLTSAVVDDLTLNGQDISTTASNKNITLTPHGTGTVTVPSGYKDRSGFAADSLATKEYVDSASSGLDVKDSCRVATTAALTVTYDQSNGRLDNAGTQAALVIDGVTLSVNDRVLVKDQAEARQNGLYIVSDIGSNSSNWRLTRADDADAGNEITGGTFTFVEEGTANSENGFVFTHDGTPTLGTTAITVTQFSGAGQITAGDALTKSGNTLNVAVDDSTIEVSSDALQIKTTYPGQASITTLGTITTGVWNGTAIAATSGGTGLTSYSTGDIIRASGANTLAALSLGANGKILQSDGSNVTYGDIDGGTY